MILADAIQAFRVKYQRAPQAVLVTRSAAVILAHQESLPSQWEGVPVRLEQPSDYPVWMAHRVAREGGTLIILSTVTDKLDRPCVVAHEAVRSPTT